MSKIDKVGHGITSISRKISSALKKAAARRDKMEKQWDRMFGSNSLRGSPVDSSNTRQKVAESKPTNFFTDDRSEDEGVQQDKFFEKSGKDKR